MLGIMGNIDQQVNDKADSMQIQGRTSTVSRDLLDVMATQKIAREKDTALKELQMAQQQNPNTIKDQLEQKVMGMTQNEMTNQTAGIMAQRQQQKQQRPQQRPPQPGGIAGAMGGAPRPPMMAQGGIVGYNKGKVVVSDEVLEELGLTRRQFDALPPASQQKLAQKRTLSPQELSQLNAQKRQEQIMANIPARRAEKEAEKRQMDQRLAQRNAAPQDVRAGLGMLGGQQPQQPKNDTPFFPTPTGKAPPPQTGTPVGTISADENAEIDAAIAAQKAGQGNQGNQGNQGGIAGAKAGTTSMTSNLEELDPNKIRAAMDTADAINQSPISDRMGSAAMNRLEADAALNPMDQLQKKDPKTGEMVDGDEVARLKKLYGLGALESMQTQEQADIKKAQETYDSPEAKRRRKLRDFALGGVRGMYAGEAKEETLELKRLRTKQEERRKNFAEIFSVVDKVDSGARQMFQDIQTQQMAALASMESIASNDELAKQNYMKLAGDAEGKAQELILGAMGVESENALRATIANMQTTQQLLDSWQKYQEGVRAAEVDMMNDMAPVISIILAKQAKGEELDDGEKVALTNAQNMAKSFVGAGSEAINQAYMRQLEILQPGFRGLSSMASMFNNQSGGLGSFQPSGMGQVGQRGPSQASSTALSPGSVGFFNQFTQPQNQPQK